MHESQEAIFFLNGQALDLFGPGRHTLETQNIPLLGKLINLPTGGKTPFHAEIYFINKTEQMAIGWGTNSRAQFLEPTYGFPLSIGTSGEMSLRITDSRRLARHKKAFFNLKSLRPMHSIDFKSLCQLLSILIKWAPMCFGLYTHWGPF